MTNEEFDKIIKQMLETVGDGIFDAIENNKAIIYKDAFLTEFILVFSGTILGMLLDECLISTAPFFMMETYMKLKEAYSKAAVSRIKILNEKEKKNDDGSKQKD